jgi:anaerobic selenocysteine-containing dehydrogenase
VPLAHGANIRGALEMGALPGVLPGPRVGAKPEGTLTRMRAGWRPEVLYLVGEAPFATRPDCGFIIAQDLYPPPFEVDAFLPAASFAETDGTLTNIEGRVQAQRAVEHLTPGAVNGFALPDWRIFSDLAGRLGLPQVQYANVADVQAAILMELDGFPDEPDRVPRRMEVFAGPDPHAGPPVQEGEGPFVMVQEHASFRHRGSDLSGVVEGLGELHVEEGLRMNPDDMERLGVAPDGMVAVEVAGLPGGRLLLPARPDPDCPAGAVYVTRLAAWGCLSGRAGLEPLAHIPAEPLRVQVASTGHAQTIPIEKGG